MDPLVRGEVLVCRPSGTRVMVRRVERKRRGAPGPQVVLWSLGNGLELRGRYAMLYLLARISDGTMRRLKRRLDAARVIHTATMANRAKGDAERLLALAKRAAR